MTDKAWKLKKLTALAIKKHQFSTAVSLIIQNALNSMAATRECKGASIPL